MLVLSALCALPVAPGAFVGGAEVAVRTAVDARRSSPELCPLPTRLSLPLPVLSSGPLLGFYLISLAYLMVLLYSRMGAKSSVYAHIWDNIFRIFWGCLNDDL